MKYKTLLAIGLIGIASASIAQDGNRGGNRNIDYATELGLNEAQTTEVEGIMSAQREAMRGAVDDSGERDREKMSAIREDSQTKLAAVLTAEQLEKLEELTQNARGNRGGGGGGRQ